MHIICNIHKTRITFTKYMWENMDECVQEMSDEETDSTTFVRMKN